jgi:hypothetical protein
MWVDSGWTWRSGCKRTTQHTHMHAHTQSFSPQTKGERKSYRRADEHKWSSFVLLPVGLLILLSFRVLTGDRVEYRGCM